MAKRKVLKLELFQPKGHFREPKILNDNVVTSLPLPPPTTIAGMLVYICGRRLTEPIDIAIIGKYKYVSTDFQRIESSNWRKSYYKELKSKAEKLNRNGEPDCNLDESFIDFKRRQKMQGISTFEIMNEGTLTIFIKTRDESFLHTLADILKSPSRYTSLGRKEDYVEILSVDIVDIDEDIDFSQREAIQNDLILKNTYVPFDIKSDEEYFERISQVGTLYVLPRIYEDIVAQKQDRRYVHHHYMHIGDNSYYIGSRFNKYGGTIFKWLVDIDG